ncbi:hypothetical protein V8G54_030902 [Vigna mungo]|uniref:BHLH domain-containing protein n=1 Tax=Vigna mungo TaxID=3915 RepID=A0AAQ3MX77_VIGMU
MAENQIFYDPVLDASAPIPCTAQMGTTKGEQRGKLPAWTKEDYKTTTMDENKRWMHRETEKQRRQEMTRLCTDFRSLLPLQYIKGKRSISDHMHEGANYIKHLENKVKELQAKRDEFKKLCNLSPVVVSNSGSFSTTDLPICVIVHPFPGGIQIKCSYSFRKYVPHTMTGTNYTELQKKLVQAISSSCTNVILSAQNFHFFCLNIYMRKTIFSYTVEFFYNNIHLS